MLKSTKLKDQFKSKQRSTNGAGKQNVHGKTLIPFEKRLSRIQKYQPKRMN